MATGKDRPTNDQAPAGDLYAPVRAAFDADFYRARYEDVAASGIDPWEHYLASGWQEGRDPTDWFSPTDYILANPDIAVSGLNPFAHYILNGRDEGRLLAPPVQSPTAVQPATAPSLVPVFEAFDAGYYVAVHPDIDMPPAEAFAHYLGIGWREFRDPTRWFSTRRYLEANPDVAASEINPFVHYVLNGRDEGRPLEHDLGYRYELIQKTDTFEPYVQALARWVPDKPASPTDRLVERLGELAAGAPLHLTVSHDNYTASFGGVQLCLKIESQAMREAGAAHVHLFPSAVSPVLDVERDHPRLGVVVNGTLAGYFDAEVIADALQKACGGRRVTLAVHSLIAHRAADIIAIAGRLKPAETYYWLHDFASLCSNYALMRNDAVFCGPPPPQSLACEICTYGARRQVHLAQHTALFEALDPVVVAPSEAALGVWRRSFPRVAKRGVVHNHSTFAPDPRPVRKAKAVAVGIDRPLRVGFLGMPTTHKGWPVFTRLVRKFAGDPRYSFHHLAKETDPTLPATWTRVQPTPKKPAPMIDTVHALELDVALIWSLWPETFCFAAYEAVAGGATILTNPDSGNVQDLIRRENCGLVIEDDVVLNEMFDTGEVLRLRQETRPARRALSYSRMTADLILGPSS